MNTHTGYGVEAYAADKVWVLLDGIHRTRAVATKAKQDLIGQHGLEADDLRVVTLTITRKEDTPMNDQTIPAAPALPEGWRLADHEKYGRVVVTRPTPDRNGNVPFLLPDDDSPVRHTWHFCFPDALAYIDTGQGADQ